MKLFINKARFIHCFFLFYRGFNRRVNLLYSFKEIRGNQRKFGVVRGNWGKSRTKIIRRYVHANNVLTYFCYLLFSVNCKSTFSFMLCVSSICELTVLLFLYFFLLKFIYFQNATSVKMKKKFRTFNTF